MDFFCSFIRVDALISQQIYAIIFLMLENTSNILQHNCSLDREKPLVLGVSGGPDSLCLLDILHDSGFQLVVAHLNHGLRPGADDEERRLNASVSNLGLEFISKKVDVQVYAKENGMSIEEGAREARYQFLFEEARDRGAQAVAVGHNANDQVETVLMHLLRGAGLAGLRGMEYRSLPNAWSADIPLVRPLLGAWREEILAYLADRGLSYETDESNADTSYYRNRLRHELIPYLKGYNPEILQVITRMAELLRGEYDVVEKSVEAAKQECWVQQGNGYVMLSTGGWRRQMTAIQRSLVRKAVVSLKPGLRDLDYQAIERGVNFLHTHHTGKCDLISGITLILEPEYFYLTLENTELPSEDWPQVGAGKEYELQIPGICRFSNGWELRAYPLDVTEEIYQAVMKNQNPYRAWLDLDKITLPLIVRSRVAGDRMRVLGMGGRSAKLSDLMINARLPERVRNLWPVVVSGQEIAWVPRLNINEGYRITREIRHILCLELSRDHPGEQPML